MTSDELQELGNSIRTLRKAAGLSQAKLAERARLSAMTVWNIENGSTKPTVYTLTQLAKVLIPDGPPEDDDEPQPEPQGPTTDGNEPATS